MVGKKVASTLSTMHTECQKRRPFPPPTSGGRQGAGVATLCCSLRCVSPGVLTCYGHRAGLERCLQEAILLQPRAAADF